MKIKFLLFILCFECIALFSENAPSKTPLITKREFTQEGASFCFSNDNTLFYKISNQIICDCSEKKQLKSLPKSLSVPYGSSIVVWEDECYPVCLNPSVEKVKKDYLLDDVKIISPKEGVWNNKQPIVLDVPEGYEVFYSINGQNPVDSGFAYDGPAIINQKGKVVIRMVIVDSKGNQSEKRIAYSVNEKSENVLLPFTSKITSIIDLSKVKTVEIPKNYTCRINDVPFNERKIALSGLDNYERFLSVELSDGKNVSRYIMSVGEKPLDRVKVQNESLFRILDWNFGYFTEKNVSFCMNHGEWQVFKEPFFINRSKENIIEWKNKDESVSKIKLPVKPVPVDLSVSKNQNQPIEISFEQSDFKYFFVDRLGDEKQVDTICFCPLSGFSEPFSALINVYAEGVFQGCLFFDLKDFDLQNESNVIVISSSAKDGFANVPVKVEILSGSGSSDIFCYIQKSYDDFDSSVPDIKLFEEYKKPLILSGEKNRKVYYSVFAFSKKSGNYSEIQKYNCSVESDCIFVVADSKCKNPDGSSENPFSTLSDAVRFANDNNIPVLKLLGNFSDVESFCIEGDLIFEGDGFTKLCFNESGFMIFENGNVSFRNCTFEQFNSVPEKYSAKNAVQNAFVTVTDSVLSVDNCQFIISGSYSSVCFDVQNSKLNVQNSNVNISSLYLSSLLTASSSECSFDNIQGIFISPQSSVVRVKECSFVMSDSVILIDSKSARVADILGSKYSLSNNLFKSLSKNNLNGIPVYQSYDSECLVNSENHLEGFDKELITTYPNDL